MIGSIISAVRRFSKNSTTPNELEKQVAKEQAELAAAPVVPSAGLLQRCHFCGQLTPSGSELRGPLPESPIRLKGRCCGG
jgi:hypothetical protein